MRIHFRNLVLGLGLCCAVTLGAGRVASADEGMLPVAPVGGAFVVACENGANYMLQSDPVTYGGDVVTGRFYFAPHRAAKVRLIPMGIGYRYAGKGFWLDGVRNRALLFLHKNRPIACNVGLAA
ncbi:hypothetical protein HMPREF9696_00961 [Afipia clevelandensis ATCC 49720]|uniref:C-type lysozyme inhibitor domain-containing protein n=1 Tax=Afipia clevelandensis ATCC 49720 TaxID=883079 RepID=K8PGP6_9BRAD|nr:hypothetical protein HMPREF9696_00961 [Afipia clevelandensis ATCC 49720]